MAQIRAQYTDPSGKTQWVPLAAEKEGNEFILKVAGNTSGTPVHYNGDANIASATVTFSSISKTIRITNLHATNTLSVSFDGGTNVFVIAPGNSLNLDAMVTSVDVNASADTTPYQILTVE